MQPPFVPATHRFCRCPPPDSTPLSHFTLPLATYPLSQGNCGKASTLERVNIWASHANRTMINGYSIRTATTTTAVSGESAAF